MTKNVNNENKVNKINLITLGDSQVGKTSLIFRYIDNSFSTNYLSTIGIDSKFKNETLSNGEIVYVKISDTAGQERFKSIASNYMKKANGIILVYDITDRMTFKNIDRWAEEINKDSQNSKPIILIGNKSDKIEERCITKEEGEQLADKCCGGIKFYETSCKTGENVEEAINSLVNDIYNKYSGNNLNDVDNNIKIEKDKKGKEKGKKKCC